MKTDATDGAVEPHDLSTFLLEFTTALLAAGSQPSRVLRSAQRIGGAFGYEVDMVILPKHVIMTIFSRKDPLARRTSLQLIPPGPFNFDRIYKLNILSWNAHDFSLPFQEVQRRYSAIMLLPMYPSGLVLVLASLANASFCGLFGGDFPAACVVFAATVTAFFARQRMLTLKMDFRVVFMVAAFIASMLAALAVRHIPTQTPQVALATSVLFLIPGVPLINAINDIIEGHILMGITRAIHASILIICIALGLSATLLIMGVDVA